MAMNQTEESRAGLFGAETEAIRCDHPGCAAPASHRAPKGRDRLNEYFWFCLDHIREYNRSWNYCAGMSDGQVESEIRNDTVWRRPTWPLGSCGGGRAFSANFRDDLGIFEAAASAKAENRERERDDRPRPDARVRRALRIMEIDGPVNLTELKSRYKELVKRLHPDANGGDRAAEDKLKDITQAYATLKKFLVA